MAQQQECWLESVWHVVNDDNGIEESDAFTDATGDELALLETFQIDPDLLNDGGPGQDDSELALQHQVIEASPEIGGPDYSEAIASDIDIYDDTFDHELEEEDDAESCPEAESHVIIEDALPEESDDFMGTAEDELVLRGPFQIDPDLLNDDGPVPDDSELALQYLEMEASSETDKPKISKAVLRDAARHEAALYNFPEADDMESFPESHILIDDSILEESDDFMETAEDELALRGVFRNEPVGINSGADPRSASEPAKAERKQPCEGMYLDWDQYMYDMRDLISVWDMRHPEFIRSEFSSMIYQRMRNSLKAKFIEEKFRGEFENGEWGENRKLLKVDQHLFDAFIDELCIERLDLRRKDWDRFVKSQMPHWLGAASWDYEFISEGYDLEVFRDGILSELKTADLRSRFNAHVSYDSGKDALEIICDAGLVKRALDEFLVEVNRLKPEYLMKKEEREIQKAMEKAIEEQKQREKDEAARKAREERERLERAEAERKEREKAEQERLAKEREEAERKAKEKAKAERLEKAEAKWKARDEEEQASSLRLKNPLTRESEIRRLRLEYSDGDLDLEDRILDMKKALAPVEAKYDELKYEYDYIEARFDAELRKRCEDEECHYWTLAEINALYQPNQDSSLVCFNRIRKEVWEKYSEESGEIKKRLIPLQKKCEEKLTAIAHEERKRGLRKRKYEARLMAHGAFLDRGEISFLSVEDFQPESGSSPDFVLSGLPMGNIGCLAGPGGLGKTQIMTQLGLDVACGRNGLTKGGILYIYGEDAKPLMERRRAAILTNASPPFSENELADIKASFIPWHLDGRRVDLADAQSEGAQIFRRNARMIERDLRRKGVRLRLIVLDTLSVFSAGKENLSEHAHALLDAMRRLCMETGASLVFLHHTTKEAGGSGNSGAGSVRGHSRLTDDVRWVSVLSGMTEKEARALGVGQEDRSRYVKMTLAKCNSVAPQKPQWFRMTDSGVFVPVDFGQGVAPKPLAAETPEIASSSAAQPAGETPGTSPIVPNQTESENSRLTSQQPDSSGNHIGNAAGRPRSPKPRPASRTGSSRFDRSFGG